MFTMAEYNELLLVFCVTYNFVNLSQLLQSSQLRFVETDYTMYPTTLSVL